MCKSHSLLTSLIYPDALHKNETSEKQISLLKTPFLSVGAPKIEFIHVLTAEGNDLGAQLLLRLNGCNCGVATLQPLLQFTTVQMFDFSEDTL